MLLNKIAIIGAGVVGQSTGKGFQRLGCDVILYDNVANVLIISLGSNAVE